MPIKFEPSSKDSLFYGQWHYSMSCDLMLAGCLRNNTFDYDKVLDNIVLRKQWDQQWRLRTWNQNFSEDQLGSKYTIEDEIGVLEVANYLGQVFDKIKLVVTRNRIWLYTNDKKIIKQVSKLRGIKYPKYTEAVVDRPKNSIRIKNSPHEYRSYFRWKFLNDTEKDSLRQFLATQHEYIRISPGLKRYLSGKHYLFLQEYYFIDYTGDQWLVMLSLINPGMLRKTVTIVTD